MTALKFNEQRGPQDEVLVSGEYPLTRRDLADIAAMIYADAGIYLNDTKASLVYSRLSKHIRNLGLSGFKEYCALVSSEQGSAARREMLSHLTTNFTRFFRENHHFDHLRDEVLPGLIARAKSGGRVRIWSAACSDGQEPYSIALTVLGLFPNATDYDFKILATDIDPKILAQARAGLYDDGALETVSPAQAMVPGSGCRRTPQAPDQRQGQASDHIQRTEPDGAVAVQGRLRRDLLPQRGDLFR